MIVRAGTPSWCRSDPHVWRKAWNVTRGNSAVRQAALQVVGDVLAILWRADCGRKD